MKKWAMRLIALVIFVVCMGLIVTGQRTIGALYLGKMLIGLVGLLLLLFIYNKKHQ